MLPGSPLESPAVLLLILGFGLKMGLVPLHVWMPLAHPVAPIPGSAVLSGIIVKAGVIGLIRFLPLDVPSPDWGTALIVLGLLTAFYGVIVGITQKHPKTVLAYSTVSQMGVVAAVIGAGLTSGAPQTSTLAAFYALHHLLVKGALFLGVGIVAATGTSHLSRVLLPMAVLALSLAGLPLTSGALAKFASKPLFGDGSAAVFFSLSAAGSTLLMLHFLERLRLLANGDRKSTPPAGAIAAWALVAGASLILPWLLFREITASMPAETFSAKAIWAACWPIAIGGGFALLLKRSHARLSLIPEGDIIVLFEKLGPLVARLGTTLDRTDATLRRWPIAGVMLLILVIAFGATLHLAR